MNYYGNTITQLIEELGRLPGIGGKSAQRLAFYLIHQPKERVEALAKAIVQAKAQVHYCSECCNFTDTDPCPICADPRRDRTTIMVVESPQDMAAYEKTKQYHGLYHVLHGAINPMLGVGPEDLKIRELLRRLNQGGVEEVILATNPNVEGEATAMYLSRLLKPLGVRVTRIANGVPVGSDLEYIDEVTLSRALEGRREM
ncbi:MAG TPA: recombination mediator RecR [Firmicutes bacterium]|nr:recombination mediator RecR [Bacillota bacterium]